MFGNGFIGSSTNKRMFNSFGNSEASLLVMVGDSVKEGSNLFVSGLIRFSTVFGTAGSIVVDTFLNQASPIKMENAVPSSKVLSPPIHSSIVSFFSY